MCPCIQRTPGDGFHVAASVCGTLDSVLLQFLHIFLKHRKEICEKLVILQVLTTMNFMVLNNDNYSQYCCNCMVAWPPLQSVGIRTCICTHCTLHGSYDSGVLACRCSTLAQSGCGMSCTLQMLIWRMSSAGETADGITGAFL